MSPTIKRFEHGNAIEIRNRIVFDSTRDCLFLLCFLPRLTYHMQRILNISKACGCSVSVWLLKCRKSPVHNLMWVLARMVICDPLSENQALSTNIEINFICTGSFPAKLRLLHQWALVGACTVSFWIMKPGGATIETLYATYRQVREMREHIAMDTLARVFENEIS